MPGKLIVDEIEDSGGNSVIGRKNYIINGNFDIWQRGTSLTGQTTSNFLADRWEAIPSGATYSYQQGTFTVGQTDVPNNPKYFANYTITGADDAFRFQQAIEDVNTLAGETITISFWAKYTTNAPTNFLTVVSQNFGSGGSTEVSTTFASGQTLTTSWQKFTVTGTLPSISGKTVGTSSYVHIKPFYNTNNEIFDVQIAQVQVEKGSVATDFERQHPGDILLQCRRYFHKVTIWHGTYATFPSGFCTGNGNGTGTARMTYEDPSMQNFRTSPTTTLETTNNTSGSYRIFRLHDNSSNDSQTVQSVGFDLVEWFDGATNHGLCQMTILWGTSATTGNFTNQAHYRINSIANSPKVRVLLDAEL